MTTNEIRSGAFVPDGEEVERCRRVRRKLESQFETRAEFFAWLERMQQEHDRKRRAAARNRNGTVKRRKARPVPHKP